MSYNMLSQIREKIAVDQTYTGSGQPHTFVELIDGKIIQMLNVEPDVLSFRDNYYYNTSENALYIKKAEWVYLAKPFDDEDESYIYSNGRSIKKMVRNPDPKNFGDKYYYSIISNKIFERIIKWVNCTNL